MIVNRFSSAGLAHSACDYLWETKKEKWRMVFRPRSLRDSTPFTIEKIS